MVTLNDDLEYIMFAVSYYRKWHVQGTCATNGEGLFEAMDMLGTYSKEFKKRQQL